MNFAIVVSRYNASVSQGLLDGALAAFEKWGIGKNRIKIVWVPGAFEIPAAAKKLALSKDFDAIVCLGCVLR